MADLEQLKAAVEMADAVVTTARDNARRAHREYEAALLESTGLAGHKVSFQHSQYRGPTVTRHILIDRARDVGVGLHVSGHRVLKDGSVSRLREERTLRDVTDCGPFAPVQQTVKDPSDG